MPERLTEGEIRQMRVDAEASGPKGTISRDVALRIVATLEWFVVDLMETRQVARRLLKYFAACHPWGEQSVLADWEKKYPWLKDEDETKQDEG